MTWPLKHEPYEVQARALVQSAGKAGFAYFMEMGLGKTATLIADFLRARANGEADVLVVVAPFSLLRNWAKEVAYWPLESLSYAVWPETKEGADVYVINYEAFAVGGARGLTFLQDLCDKRKVMIGLDESTQIKNYQSVRTKALLSVSRSAALTRVMSGAPLIQGPQDLWAQLKFIGVLYGINYFQFRNKYCVLGGFKGKQIVGPNRENAAQLSDLIAANGIRAKKKDWLDIPEKTYYARPVKLSPAYARVYKDMLSNLLIEVGDNKEVSADMAITLMLKLQQISSGFVHDDEGVAHRIEGPNAKLNELISIIDMEVDTKVIIPVYFRESQALVCEALEKAGIPFVRIVGGMSPEEIEIEKHKFNNDDAVRVAVAQTSSQKYGHTLLGSENVPCHTTIFYENTYSLDDRLQMEDRNHRIGQRHPVNCIDLPCSPTEEKVIKALQNKESVAKVIVDAIRTSRL